MPKAKAAIHDLPQSVSVFANKNGRGDQYWRVQLGRRFTGGKRITRDFDSLQDSKQKSKASSTLALFLVSKVAFIIPLFRVCVDIGWATAEVSRASTDDLDEIETVASTIKIEGARYPEEILRRSGL